MSAENGGGVLLISFLRNVLHSTGKLAELVVFPSLCRLCGSFLENKGEEAVCRDCWDRLPRGRDSFCLACGRFFGGSGEPHFCADCLKNPPAFSRLRSYGPYSGALKDLVLLLKYIRIRPVGRRLAEKIWSVCSHDETVWWEADLIIPVPLHKRRLRQRGFNQAEIIARELARLSRVRMENKWLIRTRYTPPQAYLPAQDRSGNIRGAFALCTKAKLEGKTVILVDDVCTTGSTLQECARVLLKAGASDVRAVTAARA